MANLSELEKKIKWYATAYYSGEALISDEEFDALVDQLRKENPNSKFLSTPGWGYQPSSERVKEKHGYDMTIGSLGKIKAISDIPDRLNDPNSRISAKLDGLSIVSYYKNGERYKSITRGNGKEGLNVTDKINLICPETRIIKDSSFTGAIRGEVLITNEKWELVKAAYPDQYSNPRNFVSGVFNRIELTDDLHYLDYIVYKVIACESASVEFKTIEDVDDYVVENFNLLPRVAIGYSSFTFEDFERYYASFTDCYPCDGLVISSFSGACTPKKELIYDEIAFKFQAESKIVTVTEVTYDITRTGKAFPRIWFDEVELSGAMVKKCTGFNAAYIRDNKINVGSVIEVCRSNEVIPIVKNVIEESKEGYIPETLQGFTLKWEGCDLIVEDYNQQDVLHFIKTVANVDGCGDSIYNYFIERLGLCDFDDLMDFCNNTYDYASKMVDEKIEGDHRGKLSQIIVEKLNRDDVDSIALMVAMNIPELGIKTATSIAKAIPNFWMLQDEDFVECKRKMRNINGIGDSLIESLERNKKKMDDAYKVFKYSIKAHDFQEVEERFKVAITGSLSMKRSEFERLLNANGIFVSSNFKELSYVITNNPDPSSTKGKMAAKYNVPLITEQDFYNKFLIHQD